jgi:predicted NBD/HSP70 family sugar kinase
VRGAATYNGSDVVALMRAGDVRAGLAVRQAGRRIGEVSTTCVTLLNPSVIVGSITGPNAGVLGASVMAVDHVLAPEAVDALLG